MFYLEEYYGELCVVPASDWLWGFSTGQAGIFSSEECQASPAFGGITGILDSGRNQLNLIWFNLLERVG